MDNIDYEFNEIASKTIRKYRIEKGLSLEDVVKKMKNPISRQALYKYERNYTRMKNNIFIDICNAIGIDSEKIIDEINQQLISKSGKINRDKNSLDELLNKIDYKDIENLVVNDSERKLISYVNTTDIILSIYSNLLDEFTSFNIKRENVLDDYLAIYDIIENQKNTNVIFDKLPFLTKENILERILYFKKEKLFLCIKKYYTKKDVLKELNKRFEIKDEKTGKEITDEKRRLDSLELYLNEVTDHTKKMCQSDNKSN